MFNRFKIFWYASLSLVLCFSIGGVDNLETVQQYIAPARAIQQISANDTEPQSLFTALLDQHLQLLQPTECGASTGIRIFSPNYYSYINATFFEHCSPLLTCELRDAKSNHQIKQDRIAAMLFPYHSFI